MALLLSTLRSALRAPSTAVILIGTVLLAWAGMTLGVLAVAEESTRVGELVAASCEMGACVLLLVVLARESSSPGDPNWPESSLEASWTGAWGTRAWRSAGAVVVASAGFMATMILVYVLYTISNGSKPIDMLSTSVLGLGVVVPELLCLAAWMGVFRAMLSGPASLLAGFAVLVAARTSPGAGLAGVFPVSLSFGERWGAAPERLALEAVATVGLAFVAAALEARARAR